MEYLNQFIFALLNDPLRYVGLLLAYAAAFAFIIWLWGFLDYLFSLGKAAEQEHGSSYIVQGVALMLLVVFVWEVLRSTGTLLGYNEGSTNYIALWILLAILVRAGFKKLFGSSKKH